MSMNDYLDTVEDGMAAVKAKLGWLGTLVGKAIDNVFLFVLAVVIITVTLPLWVAGKVCK